MGETMVKVSVIMPVYNCEDFLKDSVESILNQTFDDLELICVDDGSTDNSLNILKDYEKQDSRVKVYSLDHEGAGNARNFALNHISGEYLYFMDADDSLDLNAFETFYPLSKEKRLDFLMFKAKNYDVDDDCVYEKDYYKMASISQRVKDKVFNFRDISDLIFDVNVTPWSKFYNSEFVIRSGAHFKKGSKFNDNQFFWDIIFQAERIYFLDEFYYTHTVRSDSLIGSRGKNHCDSIDVNNDILDLFKKHGQFENFKETLYNRKIILLMRRYDEIADEYKELFFLKMKQDFKRNINSDFRVNLWRIMQFVHDSVLISKNHNEFDILKKYYEIRWSGNLSSADEMESVKRWFDGINKNHKMFAYAHIKKNLSKEHKEFFRKFLFRISVIVPVYNVEDYLDDAFNSLLNQSIFGNLQIIFVDDASTDSSPQIIKKYSDKYENVISIFLDENSGYAGLPRNIGMLYANADYLMFLDPDDVLTQNACETLYNQITSQNLDIVSGLISDGEKVPDWIWKNLLTDPSQSNDVRIKKCQDMLKDSDFELKIDTVEEYPSVISAANVGNRIFKKSLIEENNIYFPVSMPAEDSVFLLKALLNASGIKFINETVYIYRQMRPNSSQKQFSKDKIIKRIKAYFMMFYASIDKNKTDIFKHYLLGYKLRHLLYAHIMKSCLSDGEFLEIFIYSQPLFKLYVDYEGTIPQNPHIFEDIAKGDFESALRFVHGEETPKLGDIKCVNSTDYQIKGCVALSADWQNQFETLKPDLFVFDSQNRNDEILTYCSNSNIQTVQLENPAGSLGDVLDEVNFKYVPDLKHIVLIYRLNDLRDLNDIINHFHSIDYPFKHLKMITREENLFLKDTILEADLSNLDLGDNYYYYFADLDFEFDENDFGKAYKKFADFKKENTQNKTHTKV